MPWFRLIALLSDGVPSGVSPYLLSHSIGCGIREFKWNFEQFFVVHFEDLIYSIYISEPTFICGVECCCPFFPLLLCCVLKCLPQSLTPRQRARINLCDRCSSNYTVVLRLSGCSEKGASHLGKWRRRVWSRKRGEREAGGRFDGRTL